MMRLPDFEYRAPKTALEAASILADHSPGEAMLLGGGTDLLPNMKRRQQTPKTIIGTPMKWLMMLRSSRWYSAYRARSSVALRMAGLSGATIPW